MFPLIFLFLLGTAVGSFLNVLIDRLPRGESVLAGRSYCESCKHKLAWYDLIPLFSFVQLGGKCRYCRARLSLYHPIVEFTTAVLFVLTFLQLGIMNYELGITNIFLITYFLLFISSLIAIFFTDIKYGIIPDKILFPTIFISFLYQILNTKYEILNTIPSAFGAFAFFFFLFLVTRGRGMGFGDVKFAFFMGLILGFPNIIVGLYISFLTGAIVSLILIIWRKRKLRGGTIPFGPFLVFGTIAALFWGEKLLSLVISYLLRTPLL